MVRSLPGTAGLVCWFAWACAGGNLPPSTPEIDLSPTLPFTDDDLVVVILEPSVDPDGDPIVYQTRWYQDGELRDDIHGRVIQAERTRGGEYWIAELWATDGSLESGVASATAYVANSPPAVTVRIVPAAPDTRDDLLAMVRVSDRDGDEVDLTYAWTVDGLPAGGSGDQLPAALTTRGETWRVEVTPWDGEDDGDPAAAEAVVADSPPTAPRVRIRPERPRAGLDDLACSIEREASDADGDALSHRLAWLVDGVAFEGAVDGSLPGDTVPGDQTAEDQVWTCLGSATDGQIEGATGRDEVQIGGAALRPRDR